MTNNTVPIYIGTIPFIYRGAPYLLLVVGLPTDQEGLIQPLQSDRYFMDDALTFQWGYGDCGDQRVLKSLELPNGYYYRWQEIPLDSWNDIPAVIQTRLEELRTVLASYRELLATKPSPQGQVVPL